MKESPFGEPLKASQIPPFRGAKPRLRTPSKAQQYGFGVEAPAKRAVIGLDALARQFGISRHMLGQLIRRRGLPVVREAGRAAAIYQDDLPAYEAAIKARFSAPAKPGEQGTEELPEDLEEGLEGDSEETEEDEK